MTFGGGHAEGAGRVAVVCVRSPPHPPPQSRGPATAASIERLSAMGTLLQARQRIDLRAPTMVDFAAGRGVWAVD
jgi:hypothetical protein